MLMAALHNLVHLALLLALPPLLAGMIAKTKAAIAGRQGPPYLQLYRDLARLLRKGSVFSNTTTWVFRAGPVVSLAATLAAALLIPLGSHDALIGFGGDAVVFVYLLALGRFFTTSAALDTGSPFEGMGAAREVTFAALTEPAFFFGLLILARLTGTFDLNGMLGPKLSAAWLAASGPLVLVAASWFVVLLAENSRVPFDDPKTHLELTMIHEVMILDHSGPSLALILYGASLKLLVFCAMLVRIVLPADTGNPWLDWGAWIAGTLAVAVAVGLVESMMARLRLVNVPKLLVSACLLSGFGIILLAR